MQVGKFTLANEEKVDRALNGAQQADSTRVGGVGNLAYKDGEVWKREGEELSEKEVVSLEFALLAEYDRLGGLVKKGTDKVKTGSFYNIKSRKPHENPVATFVFMINGREVEVKDGEEVPLVVKAAQVLAEEEKPKRKKK